MRTDISEFRNNYLIRSLSGSKI